jgi:hypothetical protein
MQADDDDSFERETNITLSLSQDIQDKMSQEVRRSLQNEAVRMER